MRRALCLAAILAVFLATTFLATTGAAPSYGAILTTSHQHDTVPTDQPLPGYTISNPPLAPFIFNGTPRTRPSATEMLTPPNLPGQERLVQFSARNRADQPF